MRSLCPRSLCIVKRRLPKWLELEPQCHSSPAISSQIHRCTVQKLMGKSSSTNFAATAVWINLSWDFPFAVSTVTSEHLPSQRCAARRRTLLTELELPPLFCSNRETTVMCGVVLAIHFAQAFGSSTWLATTCVMTQLLMLIHLPSGTHSGNAIGPAGGSLPAAGASSTPSPNECAWRTLKTSMPLGATDEVLRCYRSAASDPEFSLPQLRSVACLVHPTAVRPLHQTRNCQLMFPQLRWSYMSLILMIGNRTRRRLVLQTIGGGSPGGLAAQTADGLPGGLPA